MFKICLLVVAGLALVGPQAVKGITGGIPARNREFLYQVYVKKDHRYICSGALITSRHVLTIAECTHTTHRRTVLVGTNTYRRGGDSYNIARIISHTHFVVGAAKINWVNNVAILLLASVVERSDEVDYGKLPTTEAQSSLTTVVSSSGARTLGGQPSPFLEKLEVTIIKLSVCRNMVGNHRDLISDTHLCTWVREGQGLCSWDGGAPLRQNGYIVGIGIGIIGSECGHDNINVYMDVFKYMKWIKGIIDSKAT